MPPTTVKLLPNYKGFAAVHTTFRFCRVGPRVENPTPFIIILKLINNSSSQNKGNHYRGGGLKIIIKFCELLLRISPRIINSLRSYIKHSKECFLRFPNTSKLVKKNSAAPRFSNLVLGECKYMKHIFELRMKDQIEERSSQLLRNLSSCEKKA